MKQFSKVPAIRPYIPDTAIFTLKTLHSFIKRYQMVYIKPINGARGYGVIRDPKLKWQVAGMAARVAGEKSIVTNASSSKGYVLKVEEALRQSLGLEGKKASTS